MTSLDKTRALIAQLAAALGLPSLPSDNNNGTPLEIDGRTVLIYGGDDESILLVAPVAPLPEEPGYGLTAYLLRKNLFQSDLAPFQVALDDGGTVVVWGRLQIADLDGAVLAAVLKRLAQRVGDIAGEMG